MTEAPDGNSWLRRRKTLPAAAILLLGLSGFSGVAQSQDTRVYVESIRGGVFIFLSETANSGIMLSPRPGDVLVPPLTILTGKNGTITVQVDGYELEISSGSSVVIPGRTRFGVLEAAGPLHTQASLTTNGTSTGSYSRLAWAAAPD